MGCGSRNIAQGLLITGVVAASALYCLAMFVQRTELRGKPPVQQEAVSEICLGAQAPACPPARCRKGRGEGRWADRRSEWKSEEGPILPYLPGLIQLPCSPKAMEQIFNCHWMQHTPHWHGYFRAG